MTCPDFEITDCSFSIALPKRAEILVREENHIASGELLAIKEEERFQEFDLGTIGRFLIVSPGAKIEKDQIVACKKGLLGKEAIFKSPVSGTLVEVSKQGILKIKTKSEKKEIHSPIKGRVKEIGELFLVLEFKGLKLVGNWGKGPKVLGILKICGEKEKEVKLSELGVEQAGKILVFGGKISHGAIHKAEALGIAGLVGGSISQEAESNDLAIVILGDKDGLIPKETWQEFEKKEGDQALISGEEKYLCFPI